MIKKYKNMIMFILLTIIFYLMPYTNNDINVLNNGGFKAGLDTYFINDGFAISSILIYSLTKYKLIYSLLSSLVLTLICNKTNIKSFIFIFLLSSYTLATSIFSVSGMIKYVYPLLLIYLYISNNKNYIKHILSFIIPLFAPNIAIAFTLYLIIDLIIDYNKNKKLNKSITISLIISLISSFYGFLGPGELRSMKNINLYANLELMLKYMFNFNSIIDILILVNINKYLLKKKIDIKLITLFNIIPILSIIQYLIEIIPFDIGINIEYLKIYSVILIPFNIIYLILFVKSIINKDNYQLLIIGILIALSSVLVIDIKPGALFIYYYIVLSNTYNNIKLNYKITTLVLYSIFLLLSIYNYLFDISRDKSLENGKFYYAIVYNNPSKLLDNYNMDEGNNKDFLKYKNIYEDLIIFPKNASIKEQFRFIKKVL